MPISQAAEDVRRLPDPSSLPDRLVATSSGKLFVPRFSPATLKQYPSAEIGKDRLPSGGICG
jgi:hypothetical protein